MGRPVSAHKKRLTKNEGDTVREEYVKKMRDNYPLIIRTLMHDLIVSFDKNGDIVFANDAAVEFWDKPSEELIGTPFSDYIYPEDVERSQRNLQEMVKSKGQVKGSIIRVESPQGTRTVAWNAVAIFDDDGNYVGAQATGKDLTDFLRTEEELKQSRSHFRRLFEVMVDPILIIDLTGNLLELSQSAEEILEFPREELVGKNFLESDIVPDESKAVMTKNLENFKRGKLNQPYTLELVPEVGRKLLYELTPARIMYRGQPAILVIFRNLTGQKRAEEKLQASEERFNSFLYNAPEAIWVQDVKGTFIDGNKKAEELTGYKKEELIGKNLLELLVPPESIPKIMEDFKATMFGELSGPIELEMVKKDGSLVPVEATTIPIKRDDKIEIIGITRDITERKNTVEALRESGKRFRELSDLLPEVVFETDTTGKITFANQIAFDRFGYTPQDFDKGLHTSQMLIPEEREKAKEELIRSLSGADVGFTEYTGLRKDGSTFPLMIHATPIIRGNKPVGLRGILVDITEQKKAEKALRTSEERFRSTLGSMLEGCQIIGYDWRYLYVNDSAAKQGRLAKKDFHDKTMMEVYPGIEDTHLFSVFKKCMEDRVPAQLETEFTYPNGETAWFELSIEPVPEGIFVLSIDVTDRKEVEEALRKEREMLETVTANINAGLMVVSKDYRILWANNVLKKYLGDIVGKRCYSALNQREDVCHGCGVKEVFETGKDWVLHEQMVPTPDGQEIWLEITATAIRDENGEIVAASEISVDVTEHKKFEDNLKESEEKFRTIFEGASDGIAAIEPTTMKVVFANPALVKILGFPMDKVIGSTLLDYIPKEEIAATMEKFQNGVSGKQNVFRDLTVLRQDNTQIYVDITSKFLTFGNQRYLLSFVRDVTEQKRAHESLLESEKKYREMINGMNDTVWVVDFDGKFVEVNDAAVKVSGYSRDELLSMGLTDIDNALTPEQINGLIKGMKADETQVFETEHTTKGGRTFPVEISSSHVTYQGKPAILSIARDITERKKAEKELVRFSTAVKMSNDSIILTELDGTIVDVNDAGLKMYDADDKKDLIGKNSFDLLSSEKRKEALAATKNVLSQGYLPTQEYTIYAKDGRQIISESNTAVMKDTTGKPIGYVTISRDVTEKKKAEAALRESEKKYKEMIDGMNDAALVLDLDTNIIDVNQTAIDVLGYSREELLSMNVQNIDASLTAETIKGLAKKMETNGLTVFETTHTTKDGKVFPVEISASQVTYQGKPAILSIERDITERKKAEEALRSSEEAAKRLLEFQNKIIDTATVWVNLVDLKGNVILWNRAAELVSGYSRKEIIGHNNMWSLLYPDPTYRAKLFSIGKEINEGKRIEDFYSTIKCKDGSLKTISWYSTSVRDEKGEPAGSVSIGIDVTDKEKAQQAKNNALALLKQSNTELESYTYVVSHDLKAPLRTIRSFGSFILEDYGDKLDETGQDYLNRMIRAASHMDQMIEDLLVLSRVGRKFTEIKKVDLNKLLVEILSDLEATIKETKTKVVVAKLPVLYAQKVWMRQLFMNLISNALKFNESKSPKIEVLYEEKDGFHQFKVRDNGIGIEERYLERIFKLFERAPTEKKYDGTGAGLSICKKIVEHYGGKIWVESTPGKGSTFRFTLPKETKNVGKGEQEN